MGKERIISFNFGIIMENEDKECVEKGCTNHFLLEASEIEWFKNKGLQPPKRCLSCRARKKQEKVRAESPFRHVAREINRRHDEYGER